jgi:hypothetical protein
MRMQKGEFEMKHLRNAISKEQRKLVLAAVKRLNEMHRERRRPVKARYDLDHENDNEFNPERFKQFVFEEELADVTITTIFYNGGKPGKASSITLKPCSRELNVILYAILPMGSWEWYTSGGRGFWSNEKCVRIRTH